MIVRFRHKGLEKLFLFGDISLVNAQHVARLRRILGMLNVSSAPGDMALPGYRLHPLQGDRKGQWAVVVSGNWRLVFEFEDTNATNVDLVDYH